jgi:hypothetical protein
LGAAVKGEAKHGRCCIRWFSDRFRDSGLAHEASYVI